MDCVAHAPVQQDSGAGCRGSLRFSSRPSTRTRWPRIRPSLSSANPKRFANGLAVVSRLTDGPVYVCTAAELRHRSSRWRAVPACRILRPASGRTGRHAYSLARTGQRTEDRLAYRLPGCHRDRQTVYDRPPAGGYGRRHWRTHGQEPAPDHDASGREHQRAG